MSVQAQTSPLLSLPAEILNGILQLAVTETHPIRANLPLYAVSKLRDLKTYLRYIQYNSFSGPPPITSVCKIIRMIAMPIFCASNTFDFERTTNRLQVVRNHPQPGLQPCGPLASLAQHLRAVRFTGLYSSLNRPYHIGLTPICLSASIISDGTLHVHYEYNVNTVGAITTIHRNFITQQELDRDLKCRCGAPNPSSEGYDGLNLVDLVRDCHDWVKRTILNRPWREDLQRIRSVECTCQEKTYNEREEPSP
jgi:hypothetical protein